MTELKFYKFVKNNELEYNWGGHDEINLLIPFNLIKELVDLFPSYFDEPFDVKISNSCICIDAYYLCTSYDLNPREIFE